MTELICSLRTPQDDRFSASGAVAFQYISNAENEKTVLSDAKDIARHGQAAIDDMIDKGIISGEIPDHCHIPSGFVVTVKFEQRTVAVRG
jgi:hypothetical protein